MSHWVKLPSGFGGLSQRVPLLPGTDMLKQLSALDGAATAIAHPESAPIMLTAPTNFLVGVVGLESCVLFMMYSADG